MGTFRIEIEAVGGHGCSRETRDGEEVKGCGQPFCPDCETRRFVALLLEKGNNVVNAKLIHWPGDKSSVIDDLLTRKRVGNF